MSKILVVNHSQSGNTEKMAKAFAEGAKSFSGTDVVLKKAFDATLEDLLGCDAVGFGSADYFSYIAGALKDFFDRTFFHPRARWLGNHTLHSQLEEEEGRLLLHCWIVYAVHSNSRKLSIVCPLRKHLPPRS